MNSPRKLILVCESDHHVADLVLLSFDEPRRLAFVYRGVSHPWELFIDMQGNLSVQCNDCGHLVSDYGEIPLLHLENMRTAEDRHVLFAEQLKAAPAVIRRRTK